MRFNYLSIPDDLNNSLLFHATSSAVGMVGEVPSQDRLGGASSCLGPALRSNESHILWITSFNTIALLGIYPRKMKTDVYSKACARLS